MPFFYRSASFLAEWGQRRCEGACGKRYLGWTETGRLQGASLRALCRSSANYSTDAFAGDKIKSEIAGVLAFLASAAGDVFLVPLTDTNTHAVCTSIFHVWADCIEQNRSRAPLPSIENMIFLSLADGVCSSPRLPL